MKTDRGSRYGCYSCCRFYCGVYRYDRLPAFALHAIGFLSPVSRLRKRKYFASLETAIAAPALAVTSTSDPPTCINAAPGKYQQPKLSQSFFAKDSPAFLSTNARMKPMTRKPPITPACPKLI